MSIGTLYLCATPIGNREDISLRVLRILREADLIAAEDTRHSRGLLDYYDIRKPLVSYHEHNRFERAEEIIEILLQGKNVALISDAGTPVISDPGEVLVQRAREAGVPVTSLPGACAMITALSLSGISAARFVFEGFLPLGNKERKIILEALKEERRSLIFYEAPHRLKKTLQDLEEVLGPARRCCLCRELTKIHEETLSLSLKEALEYYEEREPKGEFVLVVAGKDIQEIREGKRALWEAKSPQEQLQSYLDRGLTKKEALRAMARDFSLSKNELYDLFMK